MEKDIDGIFERASARIKEYKETELSFRAKEKADRRREIQKAKERRGKDRYISDSSKSIVLARPACEWCGIEDAEEWHIDHINPVVLGGKGNLENLAKACAPCNLTKSGKPLEEWLPIAEKRRKLIQETC